MPQAWAWAHYISTLVLLLPYHRDLNSYIGLWINIIIIIMVINRSVQLCWEHRDRVGSVPLRVILPKFNTYFSFLMVFIGSFHLYMSKIIEKTNNNSGCLIQPGLMSFSLSYCLSECMLLRVDFTDLSVVVLRDEISQSTLSGLWLKMAMHQMAGNMNI